MPEKMKPALYFAPTFDSQSKHQTNENDPPKILPCVSPWLIGFAGRKYIIEHGWVRFYSSINYRLGFMPANSNAIFSIQFETGLEIYDRR